VVSIVGGLSKEKQRRQLSLNPDIIIATPGRLYDLIENEIIQQLQYFKKLKFLVIDEADRMVELGHFPELDKIIEKIYTKKEVYDQDMKKYLNSTNNEKFDEEVIEI